MLDSPAGFDGLFHVVEERCRGGPKLDDHLAGPKRAVVGEQVVDHHCPGQVVTALACLAVGVWVLDRVVHPSRIGSRDGSLEGSPSDSVPSELVESVVIDAEVMGDLVEDGGADLGPEVVIAKPKCQVRSHEDHDPVGEES